MRWIHEAKRYRWSCPSRLHGVAFFVNPCANKSEAGGAQAGRYRARAARPGRAVRSLERRGCAAPLRLAGQYSTRRRLALDVFVGALYDVRSNRLRLLVIEHGLGGRHASTLHRPVEHDLVPEVVAEIIRMAQIRNGASVNR